MAFSRPTSPLAAPANVQTAEASTATTDITPGNTAARETASTGAREWPSDPASLITEVLRSHALPSDLIERMVGFAMAPAHAPRPVDRLAIALAAQFHFLPLEDALEASILLYGNPGAGTSTVAAKLAVRFDEHQVLVVSTDARQGAQSMPLEDYLEVLDLPLAVVADASALRSTAASAAGRRIIIDAAGAVPIDANGSERIRGLIEASRAQGTLVMPADSEPDQASALAAAAARLGTRRMIITKFDSTRYLGPALAAADAGKLALVAASVTPHFAFGLRNLTPENLARRLMSSAVRADRWRAVPL